ncbi:thiol-disulfide oxidoreductase DCC family protein [Cohnella sp. AR92]|uniref:thiol-disulfide oxidoreductase DCC family protein n=1 Tax=Cohnella sp. AR92 TaxID=648716 RepID=UPI000F8DE37F|nr:DUF393 domain-containing protein [Cohnella sp. AR92]RUS47692.1 DUF393 domain-containing protein [Cohnella sp. AR92]
MSGGRVPVVSGESASKLIALYDGHCNLCLATASKLQELESLVPVDWITIQSYQSGEHGSWPALANTPTERLLAQMHVIDGDRLYSGPDGVMKLLRNVPSLRWIGILGTWPGFRGLSRLVYKLVARYRYRLFGKNDSCADGVCSLPQSKSNGGGKTT